MIDYGAIYWEIEKEVENLKIRYGCKSWKSTCMCNEVMRKIKELREDLRTTDDSEGISKKLDVLVGEGVANE